ncbi:MAG: RsmD family RNA methyltransferase [Planctomycetia bacterium]|nr:RsmD family RNA methyltransferase [Planctomycetia bacterium]
MARRVKRSNPGPSRRELPDRGESQLRIVGGSLARRRLKYAGDPRTRPMKDRVREAVFNLIGPAVAGKHAIDLFAGTGALALEAISRGAARATLVERHYPTAAVIGENVAALAVESAVQVVTADVFIWSRRLPDLGPAPWVVFCSPPYDFYVDRRADVLALVTRLLESAPAESIFVVEADARFDYGALPSPEAWDIRDYPPARVGIRRKQ